MSNPVQPDQPRPLLERLWSTLTDPGIHDQLRSGQMQRGDLDAAVNYYTNGKLKTFQDLANTRTRQERVGVQQQLAQIRTPSRATAYSAGIANEMALGLPEKLAPYGREGAKSFTDILSAGRETYPRTEPLAEMAGNVIPATLGGGAVEDAAGPVVSRLLSKAPSLVKMLSRGATAGAGAGAIGEYGQQASAAPDWERMGKAAAFGAPFGAAGAVPAWWASTKLNPMEHMASRSIMESAPGTEPSMAAGTKALTEGTTSPMPIGRPGPEEHIFQAHPDAVNQRLPAPLQQLNFEKSPKLRADAAKFLMNDPEASNIARLALSKRIASVRQGLSSIEQGYEPVLKGRALTDADIAELPSGTQRAMNGLQEPTARDLFKRYKSLRDKASAVFDANEAGTLSDASKLDDAAEMKGEAKQLRDWLGKEGNVPGFNELQSVTGKWLQRLDELNIGRRQIVGRAIKPLGKTTDVPSGSAKEGAKELMGYTPRLITSRAARRLAPILLSPKLSDLLEAAKTPELKEIIPDLIRSVPSLAGAAAGPAINSFTSAHRRFPADATSTKP